MNQFYLIEKTTNTRGDIYFAILTNKTYENFCDKFNAQIIKYYEGTPTVLVELTNIQVLEIIKNENDSFFE